MERVAQEPAFTQANWSSPLDVLWKTLSELSWARTTSVLIVTEMPLILMQQSAEWVMPSTHQVKQVFLGLGGRSSKQ